MNASMFTYGKGMHYSVSEDADKNTWPVVRLKQLEKSIKRYLGVDAGFILPNNKGKGGDASPVEISENIDHLLAYAVPLLKVHVDKCLDSIKRMNEDSSD